MNENSGDGVEHPPARRRKAKAVPASLFSNEATLPGPPLSHAASTTSSTTVGNSSATAAANVASAGVLHGTTPKHKSSSGVAGAKGNSAAIGGVSSAAAADAVAPTGVATDGPGLFSPLTSVAGTFSNTTCAALDDKHGLPVRERTIVSDHITNTKAVVRLVELEYSDDTMRAYRVCRQAHIGASANTRPLLQMLSVNDMVLLALSFAFLLPLVIAASANSPRVPQWWRSLTTENEAVSRGAAHWEAALPLNVRVLAPLIGFVLVLVHVLRAYYRVQVEEVLAIRGIGLQLSTYDVFHRVRSRELIDVKLIRSLVLHDAFFRYQPIFFLSSSIENRASRVVYFAATLPRLEVLRPVLCGLRHVLYGEEEHGLSLSEMETAQLFLGSKADTESGGDETNTTRKSSEVQSEHSGTDGEEYDEQS